MTDGVLQHDAREGCFRVSVDNAAIPEELAREIRLFMKVSWTGGIVRKVKVCLIEHLGSRIGVNR